MTDPNMIRLLELSERLTPSGEVGDGMVAQFHESAALVRASLGDASVPCDRVGCLVAAGGGGFSIPMVLHCPNCGEQHIDAPDPKNGWHNPPHRSHKCLECGVVWRPADVATTGVEKPQTVGKSDTWVFGWLRHDKSPDSPVPKEFYVEHNAMLCTVISPASIADWYKITKYRLHARSDLDLQGARS